MRTTVLRLALLACAALLGACATTLLTGYAPLHPANQAAVEFWIEAEDRDGVRRLELFVYEYELYSNEGMASARRREAGVWDRVRQWEFADAPRSIEESYLHAGGFPAHSLVSYLVRVTDESGNETSERWSFAAGEWPWPELPIPLWTNGAPAERIDVAFVADRDDYASARDMLPDLEPLVFDGYQQNNVVRRGKGYWQFYYSPEMGRISDYDAPDREMEVPAALLELGMIDSVAIIHTTLKRDWARGGNFGTEPTNPGTALHESGHAVFGLADEYAGGVHWRDDPFANNYGSQADCRDYNRDHGWPANACELIEDDWWRAESRAEACLMREGGTAVAPAFARSCLRRAEWFYGELD